MCACKLILVQHDSVKSAYWCVCHLSPFFLIYSDPERWCHVLKSPSNRKGARSWYSKSWRYSKVTTVQGGGDILQIANEATISKCTVTGFVFCLPILKQSWLHPCDMSKSVTFLFVVLLHYWNRAGMQCNHPLFCSFVSFKFSSEHFSCSISMSWCSLLNMLLWSFLQV